jgi:hypothetical protein
MTTDEALNLADSGDYHSDDPLVVLAEEVKHLRSVLKPLCKLDEPPTREERMRARAVLYL